jgi:hypothetical protein
MSDKANEVLREGGDWLGACREYLLWHAHRGDSLQWFSDDRVEGLSVRNVEEMVATAVAADRRSRQITP